MNKTLAGIASWFKGLMAGLVARGSRHNSAVPEETAWQFVEEVMRKHHFTPESRSWLRSKVRLRVDQLTSTNGGGYWQPSTGEVRLFTGQHEAAVHELAHAWWHYRRERLKDEMIEATLRLSAEKDPRYQELARLAFGYVHGIPEQPWEGLLVTRNDWEMFAGFASGTMGDMRKVPPYMRRLYRGLFEMPDET